MADFLIDPWPQTNTILLTVIVFFLAIMLPSMLVRLTKTGRIVAENSLITDQTQKLMGAHYTALQNINEELRTRVTSLQKEIISLKLEIVSLKQEIVNLKAKEKVA